MATPLIVIFSPLQYIFHHFLLISGYLEALTLGSLFEAVAANIEGVITAGQNGQSNGPLSQFCTCKIITFPDLIIENENCGSFSFICIAAAWFLGVQLFVGNTVDEAGMKWCIELQAAINRRGMVIAQDGFILPLAFFGALHVIHI